MAELIRPMIASFGHIERAIEARSRHRNGNKTSAPRARRISTRANAPNGVAAIRMNRNEPPQMAPSSSNSRGVRQSPANAAGLRPSATVVLSDDIAPAPDLCQACIFLEPHSPTSAYYPGQPQIWLVSDR